MVMGFTKLHAYPGAEIWSWVILADLSKYMKWIGVWQVTLEL